MIFELYVRTCIVDECKIPLGPELQEISSSLNGLVQKEDPDPNCSGKPLALEPCSELTQEDPAPLRVLSKIPSITDSRRECGD